MDVEHGNAIGDESVALARKQMREYLISTLASMGIPKERIIEQTEILDLWQERLAELVRLGFEPTQFKQILRPFAEIWFSSILKASSVSDSTAVSWLLNAAPPPK